MGDLVSKRVLYTDIKFSVKSVAHSRKISQIMEKPYTSLFLTISPTKCNISCNCCDAMPQHPEPSKAYLESVMHYKGLKMPMKIKCHFLTDRVVNCYRINRPLLRHDNAERKTTVHQMSSQQKPAVHVIACQNDGSHVKRCNVISKTESIPVLVLLILSECHSLPYYRCYGWTDISNFNVNKLV